MPIRKNVMSDIHIAPANTHGRKMWIDIFRGVSIILVIIGHLYIPAPLYRFIFSFHMYAFFFLSGVTWKSEKMVQTPVGKYAFNSFTHLFIPYLIYAFLWNVTDSIMQAYMTGNLGSSFVDLTENFIYSFFGFGSTGPAWFLYCLLTTRTLYYFVTRITSNRITKGCIFGGLFLIGFLLNGKTFLPFYIIQSLTSVFFLYLGELYSSTDISATVERITHKSLGAISIASVCGILCYFLAQSQNCDLILAGNSLPDNVFLILCTAVLGIIVLLLFSKVVSNTQHLKCVAQIGKNSLLIMGLHSEIRVLCYLGMKIIEIPFKEYGAIPVFVITIAVCMPMAFVANKYLPFLVGACTSKNKKRT